MKCTFNLFVKTWCRFGLLLLIWGSTLSVQASGQDSAKVAIDLFEIGMETYNFSSIRDARELFIQATQFKPDMEQAQFMAGKCILETVNKGEALPYLLKAYELNNTIHEDILDYIAQAYHFRMEFEKAIEFYTRYRERVEKKKSWDKEKMLAEIDRHIKECSNARVYLENAASVEISNLGSAINTEYPEYGPIVSADESILIYTARRDDNVSYNKAPDNLYYEDIYVASRVNGEWQKATNIGSPVNTDFHDAVMGLSPSGNTLFIYKDQGAGDIYQCDRNADGSWSRPRTLGSVVNSSYKESSVSISGDGQHLYFSSERPGGYGGSDIYHCARDKKGRWLRPSNLGPQINTPLDEDGVFVSSDGKTLYFSSRGHDGMGGFDIYLSHYDEASGSWGKPINLGYPINSVDEDIYFALSGNGKRGYYSSIKSFGKGEKDLYVVDMTNLSLQPIEVLSKRYEEQKKLEEQLESDGPVSLEEAQPITLKVYAVEFGSQDTLKDVRVEVSVVGEKQLIEAASKDIYSSSYEIKVNKATQIHISVWKQGYINFEDQVTIPAAGREAHEIDELAVLQEIGIGARGVMDIYFESQSTNPASYEEVGRLVRLMQQNPGIRIRILGHTDNVGNPEFNRKLSEDRARHIRDYIIKQGIDAGRLDSKGYGFDKPVASNDTEAGRRRNRRTEFEIIR